MTGHPITVRAEALIFDLDGTLIDSASSLRRTWSQWAAEHGIGREALIAAVAHGLTSAAVVDALVPPEAFEAAYRRIDELESTDVADIAALPGAELLLAKVPEGRKAIATSGTRSVAGARLRAAGLTPPEVMVTADDVRRGKPDPEPFLRAASMLGVRSEACAVIEDSPAGLTAAHAAGMRAIAVTTTTQHEKLASADLIVEGLHRLEVEIGDGSLTVVGVSPA